MCPHGHPASDQADALLFITAGVDKEHNQLVVAIIDFIRTYTWDKQLETWVKSSGILGGAGGMSCTMCVWS